MRANRACEHCGEHCAPCCICEGAQWLTETGETHPEAVAHRLGVSRATLMRHLAVDRHFRPEITGRLLDTRAA